MYRNNYEEGRWRQYDDLYRYCYACVQRLNSEILNYLIRNETTEITKKSN